MDGQPNWMATLRSPEACDRKCEGSFVVVIYARLPREIIVVLYVHCPVRLHNLLRYPVREILACGHGP